MELWDLYTRDRRVTGRTHVRGEPLPPGSYHLVVHIWIRNSRGEYLISQRSADRPSYPLMWECVGGSVIAGESSLEGAIREVSEEVGIKLAPGAGRMVRSMVRDGFNDICDIWLFESDDAPDLKRASTAEVAQTGWMSRAQVRGLADKGMLVDTLGYFFEMQEL